MAEQTTSLLSLQAPVNGQNQVVDFIPGSAISFGFTPLGFERSGADLLIEGDGNSSITLKNFFTGESTLPKFILPELGEVFAEDLLKENNIDTAMGPQPLNPAASGGFSSYESSFGTFVDGIDTLDTLSGQQWASRLGDISPAAGNNALIADAPSGLTPSYVAGGSQPEAYIFNGFHARAIIYTGSQNYGSVPVDALFYDGVSAGLLGSGLTLPLPARIYPTAAGNHGDIDITPVIMSDGTVNFVLNSITTLPERGAAYFLMEPPGGTPYVIQILLLDDSNKTFNSLAQDVKDAALLAPGGLVYGEWFGGNTEDADNSYAATGLKWVGTDDADNFYFTSGSETNPITVGNALGASTIDMGDGNNTLTVRSDYYGIDACKIVGGADDDSLFFGLSPFAAGIGVDRPIYASTIQLGGGNNSLIVEDGSTNAMTKSTLTTGSGADTVSLTSTTKGLFSSSLTLGHGDNDVFISSQYAMNNSTLSMGTGLDKLTINATSTAVAFSNIKTGGGADTVSITGTTGLNASVMDLSIGNDLLEMNITGTAFAGASSANLGGNNDTAVIKAVNGLSGASVLDFDAGNDTLSLEVSKTAIAGASTIDMGGNHDTAAITADIGLSGKSLLNMGSATALENDVLTINVQSMVAQGESSITMGGGFDKLYITSAGNVLREGSLIDTGTGADFVTITASKSLFHNNIAGNNRIDLGADNDTFVAKMAAFANGGNAIGTLAAGDGNDYISISVDAFNSAAVTGHSIIQGGAGDDHVALTSTAGTKSHYFQNIDVDGGAGGKDLLQVGGSLVWNANTNTAGIFTAQNGLTASNHNITGFEALRIDLDDGAPQSINIEAILSNIKTLALSGNTITDVYIMRDAADHIDVTSLKSISDTSKAFKEVEIDSGGNTSVVSHTYAFDSYQNSSDLDPTFANLKIHLQTTT